MMRLIRHLIAMSFIASLFFFTHACSPKGEQGENASQKEKISSKDGGNADTPTQEKKITEGEKHSDFWPRPKGYAAIEFVVDDSANKTYKDKQLLWNGSFVYDEKTRIIKYSSAWQPTDGPFPPLYDDGPIDQNGHEPVGSKAGDHIFGIVVFVKPAPDRDLEFEYGVINEDDNWLWEGKNGTVTIKKGSTDIVKAKGLVIPKHGSIDIKITLNLKQLPKEFALDDIQNPPPIFIKGTMTNWGHIQVLDTGKKGDDKAKDGIITFVQSKNLDYSPHLGLLQYKRHVQFVFQFNSTTGREYKDLDDKAIKTGVQAWADCNGDGQFTDDEKQEVIHEKDSRGAVFNTAIIVCKDAPPPCTKDDCNTARCKDKPICKGGKKCQSDKDCASNERCETSTGKCVSKQNQCTKKDCATSRCKDDPICRCQNDNDCQQNEVCDITTGQCHAKQKCKSAQDCPPDHLCETTTGRCLLKPCQPSDCKEDRCKNSPVCTSNQKGPLIYFVIPGAGPLRGGTPITIKGERFQQGLKVRFGKTDALDVKVISKEEIHCKSPSHSQKEAVDVTVENPDGLRNTYPRGFTYDDKAINAPRVTSVVPIKGDVSGGTEVLIQGRNFQSGAKVLFDKTPVAHVQFIDSGSLKTKTPPHAIGKVAVTVINPDNSKDTLPDAFEYYEKIPKIDWARITSPRKMTSIATHPSPFIYAEVYDAAFKTKNNGPAKGIIAEVGWGPQGSDPKTWPAQHWKTAQYNKDIGNNDEYKGNLIIPQAGTYSFAFRFSVDNKAHWVYVDTDSAGTNNGYNPKDSGIITVIDSQKFSIRSVQPNYGIDAGGNIVIIEGGGFQQGVTVKFGGTNAPQVIALSKVKLRVTTPKHSPGKVDLTIELNGKTQTLTKGFTFTGIKANIGWCNTQWPRKMPDPQHHIPAPQYGKPTQTIYGIVYKKGVTDKKGQGPGIVGHVGYGPLGTDPKTSPRWTWFPAVYNTDKKGLSGWDNDEYRGTITPTQTGTFNYVYRFSSDGIYFWLCTLAGNTPQKPYKENDAAKMTVK